MVPALGLEPCEGVLIGVELGIGAGVAPGLGLGLMLGVTGVPADELPGVVVDPPGLVVLEPGSPELLAPPVLAPPLIAPVVLPPLALAPPPAWAIRLPPFAPGLSAKALMP